MFTPLMVCLWLARVWRGPRPTMPVFRWDDVCVRIISMPSSRAARESVLAQLEAQRIGRASVAPGIVLTPRTIDAVVSEAARSCSVPHGYAASNATARWLGTVGSSLAHLNLLRSEADHLEGRSCSWLMVVADDVVLLPGFAEWVSSKVMRGLPPTADFVNLAVVRAWGRPQPDSVAMRVSGALTWRAWTRGDQPTATIKNPNLLVSGYLLRLSTLPTLLASFSRTRGWRRECSIDQVLSRVQYALASAGRYETFNVDATVSLLAHCAVSATEMALLAKTHPERHHACRRAHPDIYGAGSRSHDRLRLRRLSVVESSNTSVPAKRGLGEKPGWLPRGEGCYHAFHVPADRIALDSSGGLVTLPHGPNREAASEVDEALRHSAACLYARRPK